MRRFDRDSRETRRARVVTFVTNMSDICHYFSSESPDSIVWDDGEYKSSEADWRAGMEQVGLLAQA